MFRKVNIFAHIQVLPFLPWMCDRVQNISKQFLWFSWFARNITRLLNKHQVLFWEPQLSTQFTTGLTSRLSLAKAFKYAEVISSWWRPAMPSCHTIETFIAFVYSFVVFPAFAKARWNAIVLLQKRDFLRPGILGRYYVFYVNWPKN